MTTDLDCDIVTDFKNDWTAVPYDSTQLSQTGDAGTSDQTEPVARKKPLVMAQAEQWLSRISTCTSRSVPPQILCDTPCQK